MISIRAEFPSGGWGRLARDQAARFLRFAVVAPSLCLGLDGCGAASAPRPMDTLQQEASVIPRASAAFDDAVVLPAGTRALLPFYRLDRCANVTLRSFHPRSGHYDVRIEVGKRRVVEVPAGRFEAIEVVVGDYSEPLTYLVRAVRPHFILRYEIPGVGGVVELAGITPSN